ncbi:unnamed protein product [Callosobruchus maculatus]|uniref:C2H2-type domain-containing protein n=1 Tax=Callosobruchus maculatus TaxID=64391 RepID=A0A653CP39_CALMS|nr:unnamed protein product [Callosobruchus maculatus]
MECMEMEMDSSDYEYGYIAEESSKPHMCSYDGCNESFKKNSLLKRHMFKHTGERPFPCDIPGCNAAFLQTYHLKRHKSTVHNQDEKHVCDEENCNKIFNNSIGLQNHKNNVHSPLTYLHTCPHCLKGFKKKYYLASHMFSHARAADAEKDKKEQSPSKNTLTCIIEGCGASYKKLSYLKQHMRKHTGERPFVCDVDGCDKSYAISSHLNRHKARVHERTTEYICKVDDCGKVLIDKRCLEKHMERYHSFNGPYKCIHCMLGFTKKYALRRHLDSHRKDSNYKCHRCNVEFPSRTNYLKHMYRHKTRKLYTCDCGKVFELKAKCREHQKECPTQQTGHICSICNKSFTTGFNLRQHSNVVHSEVKEVFKCPYLNCDRSYNYKKNLNVHIHDFHEKVVERYECPVPGCTVVCKKKQYMTRHVENVHTNPKPRKTERKPRKTKGIPTTNNVITMSGLNPSHKKLLKNPQIDITTLAKEKGSNVTSKENSLSSPALLEDSAQDETSIRKDVPDATINALSDVWGVCYSAENSRGSREDEIDATETTLNTEASFTKSSANKAVKEELVDEQSSSAIFEVNIVSEV